MMKYTFLEMLWIPAVMMNLKNSITRVSQNQMLIFFHVENWQETAYILRGLDKTI